MLFNYIIGPAGSGKSTLVGRLKEYISMRDSEITVIAINLDPGALNLNFNADIDIRDYITLDEVMTKYNLGPNGGIILASDLMINFIEDLKYEIEQYQPDWVLIDTAGQLELFAFRDVGPIIASSLGFGDVQRSTTFLFDANMVKRPNGFVSTLLLAASVQYRFINIPQINTLSKTDLLQDDEVDMILNWSTDFDALSEATNEREKGLIRELSLLISQVFSQLGSTSELIPITTTRDEGMDILFGVLQRVFDSDKSQFY
jgi:GTPase SAR1 family protein